MPRLDTTGLLNSTSLTRTEGFGGFIRPTPIERAMGRLMRAPDHDAGDAPGDGGADADATSQAADKGPDGDDTGAATDLASATADDGTGDADGKGGKDTKDDKVVPEPVVPETYELKITSQDADGKDVDVELDPALIEAATPVLKDVGLTNEQANKLAPLAVKVQERMIEQQAEAFEATKADWAKETQADPEIGGKKWKETQGFAAKALDHYAGGADKNEDGSYKSGFRQLLVDTGLTNHPDMARFLRKVGADRAEDTAFARSEAKAVKKSPEEENYPDDVPKK